jgi:hypothetical protein
VPSSVLLARPTPTHTYLRADASRRSDGPGAPHAESDATRDPASDSGSTTAADAGPSRSLTYLRDLTIKNLALVTDQVLELKPGLNIITGER